MENETVRFKRSYSQLQESFNKLAKRWKANRPIHRDALRVREDAALVWIETPYKEYQPTWFSEVSHHKLFQSAYRIYAGAIASGKVKEEELQLDPQTAFMAWMAGSLRNVTSSSTWFLPSEGLVYKLLATELKGVLVGDVLLPVPAFYIELPENTFCLYDKSTGWHPVRALSVVQGEVTQRTIDLGKANHDASVGQIPQGRRLVIEMYGSPNSNSTSPFDDTWLFKSYDLTDHTEDLFSSTGLYPSGAPDDAAETERGLNKAKLGERVLDGIQIRRELLRFVANFILYVGTHPSDVRHVHKDELNRLTGGKSRKKMRKSVRKKVARLKSERVFVVGSRVPINSDIRDAVLAGKKKSGTTLSYRTMVRGHWRNQAYGPKLSKRKRLWIEPHVRGAELPTPIVGHEYVVT